MTTVDVEEAEDTAAAVDTADEAVMMTIGEEEDTAAVVDMMTTVDVEEVEDTTAAVDTADEADMMTIAEEEDTAAVEDTEAATKSVAHTVFVRIMVSCLEILTAVGRF